MNPNSQLLIIAHIDHAKATLRSPASRLPARISDREMQEASPGHNGTRNASAASPSKHSRRCGCSNTAQDGETSRMNLIDTPGHVRFSPTKSAGRCSRARGSSWLVAARRVSKPRHLPTLYMALEQDSNRRGRQQIRPPCASTRLRPGDRRPDRIDAADVIQSQRQTGRHVDQLLEAIVRQSHRQR